MSKKTLSLILALAMCLGQTLPVWAAEKTENSAKTSVKAGDTTVTDKNGNTYTLSNPVLYTVPHSDIAGYVMEDVDVLYAVPVGTVVTPPENAFIGNYEWTDVIWKDKNYQLSPVGAAGDLWDWFELDVSSSILVLGCFDGIDKTAPDVPTSSIEGSGTGGSHAGSFLGSKLGTIAFYIPDEEHFSANPFASLSNKPSTPEQPAGAYQVSNWAKDQVAKAEEIGLIPDGLGEDYRVSITRAQFAAATVKLYAAMSGKAVPAAKENPFTDTADPAVLQAAEQGFVSGMGDGTFAPDSLVTREQAASMLSRVYTKLGGIIPAVAATSFADNGSVSGWARDAVAFMSDKGIVSGMGDNTFNPKGSASIEQALSISLRMFEKLK